MGKSDRFHDSPATKPKQGIDPDTAELAQALKSQSKMRITAGELDQAALAQGTAALRQSDPASRAAIVAGVVPLVLYELPSTIHAATFDPKKLLFVPWGWDTSFGGSLTLTAGYQGVGTLGRAYVAGNDQLINDFKVGRFICVGVRNGAPAVVLDVDLCSTETARAAFEENWLRATQHVALATDERARFWESIRGIVGEGDALTPAQQLSLSWVKRYGQAIRKLHGHVTLFRRDFHWPAGARLPTPFEDLTQVIGAGDGFTTDALLNVVRMRHVLGNEKLTELRHPAWHDAIHKVIEDHTPLCDITSLAVDAYLLSSEQTTCGQRVPRLDDGQLAYHAIRPDAFASKPAAMTYWQRVIALPVEWTSLAKPSDVPADFSPGSPMLAAMPRAENCDAALRSGNALLEEALSERKWTIPSGAMLEIGFGPFTHFELSERNACVEFILRSPAGEFTAGGIHLTKNDRRIWWEALTHDPEELDRRMPIAAGLYLMLAAIIRDFLVVEERERVFQHKTVRRAAKTTGNDQGPRIVYLPRVSYSGGADLTNCREQLNQQPQEPRAHAVRPHFRRVGTPSAAQLFIARRYGMEVPKGHTFVRPHERGKTVRDVIYRSRSALQCLFHVAGRHDAAGVGREAWFQFERDVHQLMESLNFNVEHVAASGRGDRGVDVFATKGHDLEHVAWVIQCKAYSPDHKIGPHVVRELCGTLAEYPQGTRGMVVTTSSFTSETRQLALRHNIRLMAGDEFAAMLSAKLKREDPGGSGEA